MKALESSDLSSLTVLLFHLMTCYTLRPCPKLAAKVVEHLEVLLADYGEVFGPWQGTLIKMRDHWQLKVWERMLKTGEKFEKN